MTNMQKKKGFTLIELLVVIAIIGLLSTLAVIALNSARKKSRDAKRVADVKQVQTALEMYFNQQNDYPTCPSATPDNTTVPFNLDTGFDVSNGCADTFTEYMSGINNLKDPTEDGTTAGVTATSNVCHGGNGAAELNTQVCNYGYTYAKTTAGNASYAIYFFLEEATGSTVAKGLNKASPEGITACTGTVCD